MHPKKFPKATNNRQKHISPYKSSNILGELYVKPCAESNDTTPGLGKWCDKKIRPKN